MIINRFNRFLRAEHEDQPPANNPGTAAPETQTEPPPKREEDGEEGDDPPAPAAPPTNPEAAATPVAPKLSIFERGKLRMLGMGDLVARVEKAEGELSVASAEVVRLNAENLRLQGELATLKEESPKQLAAAKEIKSTEISKKVTAELTGLGITAEAAPSQVSADATPEALLEKLNSLKGAEKTAFFRANRTALKAADAAKTAK